MQQMNAADSRSSTAYSQSCEMLKTFTVPKATVLGFKALTVTSALVQSAITPTHDIPLDWSALYPQLSFKSALAYLPNQWDRGHTQAQIAVLITKKPIQILLSTEELFTDVTISSSQKADRIRELYELHKDKLGLNPLASNVPLMDALGQHELALCIPDAEGLELALPHCMTSEEQWLDVQTLFVFEQSLTVPFTIGKVVGFNNINKHQLADLNQLYEVLSKKVTPLESTAVLDLIQSVE